MPPVVTAAGNGVFRVGDAPARTAWAATSENARWVFYDGHVYVIEHARGGGRPPSRSHGGSLTAPMPATVRKINVAPGDSVKAGDVLVVLEAMKMELPVRAPAAGTITSLLCSEGELVQAGASLVTMEGQ
jgi:biotin carboxyl carrier protein